MDRMLIPQTCSPMNRPRSKREMSLGELLISTFVLLPSDPISAL